MYKTLTKDSYKRLTVEQRKDAYNRYKKLNTQLDSINKAMRNLRKNSSKEFLESPQMKNLELRIFELNYRFRTGRAFGAGVEHR